VRSSAKEEGSSTTSSRTQEEGLIPFVIDRTQVVIECTSALEENSDVAKIPFSFQVRVSKS
jgi:hypothetical protein